MSWLRLSCLPCSTQDKAARIQPAAAGQPCPTAKISSLIQQTRASLAAESMTTQRIDGVSVTTQANVYFDGKCVSHSIVFPDGTTKSVGVVLPASLTFNTSAPEIMECVAGACDYKLDGSTAWVRSAAGDKFSVPGNSKFEIRVTEAYHYICHFG